MPTGMEQSWERSPSRIGQIGGGLLGAAGLGLDIYKQFQGGGGGTNRSLASYNQEAQRRAREAQLGVRNVLAGYGRPDV